MKTLAQKIAAEWKDYRAEAEAIGTLPDDTRETEVDELKVLLGSDYEFARDCGQELAKYGLVTYVKGSKGWKSRVRWDHTPRAISNLLLGNPMGLADLLASANDLPHDASGYRGQRVWTLDRILTLISEVASVDRKDVVIDLKIPEAKAILARSQGIPVDDVSVRLG
ncbi:MAG: hypothetical protein U1E58_11465 [Tabrizicola sp.]